MSKVSKNCVHLGKNVYATIFGDYNTTKIQLAHCNMQDGKLLIRHSLAKISFDKQIWERVCENSRAISFWLLRNRPKTFHLGGGTDDATNLITSGRGMINNQGCVLFFQDAQSQILLKEKQWNNLISMRLMIDNYFEIVKRQTEKNRTSRRYHDKVHERQQSKRMSIIYDKLGNTMKFDSDEDYSTVSPCTSSSESDQEENPADN